MTINNSVNFDNNFPKNMQNTNAKVIALKNKATATT